MPNPVLLGQAAPTMQPYPIAVPEGCVLYYDMQDIAGKIVDHSGYRNHGINSGSVAFAGPNGLVRSFDGVDDVINVTAASSIDAQGKNTLTLETWVYAKTTGEGGVGTIMVKGSGYNILFSSGKMLVLKYRATTNANAQTSNNLTLNAWKQVLAVYNRAADSKWEIYFDGILQALGTDTAGAGTDRDDTANNLQIGNLNDTRTWDGYIGHVRIYNRALTAAEVRAAYRELSWFYGVA